jgi:hypothetical protein
MESLEWFQGGKVSNVNWILVIEAHQAAAGSSLSH